MSTQDLSGGPAELRQDGPGEGIRPAFRSLALESIPVPDYADVIVVPVPAGCTPDPRLWAEMIFSTQSMPVWIRTLMGMRQSLMGMVGIHRAPAGVFDVAELTRAVRRLQHG